MKTKKPLHICITGGHMTPALAVIEYIKTEHKEWDISYIGRPRVFAGKKILSEEEQSVSRFSVPFYPVTAGRLQRFLDTTTFENIWNIPVGFFQSLAILKNIRPTVILSFGGYVALPVALAGFFLGIPVVTHEQTRSPGLANRIIGIFAKRILVSFQDMVPVFNQKKTAYTGLPLRKEIFFPPKKPSIPVPSGIPFVFITGGATGALSMNEKIFPIIPQLVTAACVVHQTGQMSYDAGRTIQLSLPKHMKSRYIVRPFFSAGDVSYFLHHAVLIICRSGANTAVEILATGARAIAIPLPWSGGQEQKKNAEYLTKLGNAVIFNQEKGTPKELLALIKEMMGKEYKNVSHPVIFPADTVKKIVEELRAITLV